MTVLKVLAKRVVDGALRRLGFVRAVVAATQTVDAIYLSLLGRTASVHEAAEAAEALRAGLRSAAALVDTLGESAEGTAHFWRKATPDLERAGFWAPQAHFEKIVEAVLYALLGRPPENDACAAYAGALRSGRLSMESFVSELANGQEVQERHLRGVIDAAFKAALGRPADDVALRAFVNSVGTGVLTLDQAIEELSTGSEARQRAFSLLKPVLKDRSYVSKAE